MKLPRRYRVGLAAHPPGYRRERGAELAATLADGDDDRGRPSTREAVALVRRGLALRLLAAASPGGLLALSALLLLAAACAPEFLWADTGIEIGGTLLLGPHAEPSMWWRLALGVLALAILCGGRRRLTLALAVPLAVAVFSSVGRLFVEIPEPRDVEQFASWLSHVIVDQWPTFLGMLAAALGATWAVLFVGARLEPAARARMLAIAVALAGALCVAQAVARPGEPGRFGIYEGSWHEEQIAALGLPTFLAATAVALALGALVAGSRSPGLSCQERDNPERRHVL